MTTTVPADGAGPAMRLAPTMRWRGSSPTTTASSAPSTPRAGSTRCRASSPSTSDGFVGVPVDRVKPKSPSRLQREHNLESDSRATLLVEHGTATTGRGSGGCAPRCEWEPHPSPERMDGLAALLADRYPQYRDRPFDRVLVLRIVDVTGWAAS